MGWRSPELNASVVVSEEEEEEVEEEEETGEIFVAEEVSVRGWAAGAHDHFMDDDDDATTARVVAAASAATQWAESETMTSARHA